MNDHVAHMLTEASASRDISRRVAHRALFFAGLLIFSHLVNLRFENIQTSIMTLKIDDVSIINATIAIIMLYNICHSFSRSDYADILISFIPHAESEQNPPRSPSTDINVAEPLPPPPPSPAKCGKNIKAVILFPYRLLGIATILLASYFGLGDIYTSLGHLRDPFICELGTAYSSNGSPPAPGSSCANVAAAAAAAAANAATNSASPRAGPN